MTRAKRRYDCSDNEDSDNEKKVLRYYESEIEPLDCKKSIGIDWKAVRECVIDKQAGDPYSDRPETVTAILRTYGFYSDDNNDSNKDIDVPDVCFESYIRKKLNDESIPIFPSISEIATFVREQSISENIMLTDMGDQDLVKYILSHKNGNYPWISFCYSNSNNSIENTWKLHESKSSFWHCRHCQVCREWQEWHCKGGCNNCNFGITIPCEICQAKQFNDRIS